MRAQPESPQPPGSGWAPANRCQQPLAYILLGHGGPGLLTSELLHAITLLRRREQ
ncbi:unannotated protein [freshwater metagenome]|uniref:Unannotated protein n=1 Tax=freshwater metagenome TaxID=449393 RepID=A0A6J7IJE2_9ZZZZ